VNVDDANEEIVPALQAGLAEAKEIQAACRAAGIAVELGRDDHCTTGCAPKVLLLARRADLPVVQHVVAGRWAALLDEGAVVHAGGPEDEDEEPPCPACGSTGALVDGACPECGLSLA
jgi:hypothetical protein